MDRPGVARIPNLIFSESPNYIGYGIQMIYNYHAVSNIILYQECEYYGLLAYLHKKGLSQNKINDKHEYQPVFNLEIWRGQKSKIQLVIFLIYRAIQMLGAIICGYHLV